MKVSTGFSPEREAQICTGCPALVPVGVPPGDGCDALTCADSINPLDRQPAIADRSLSENRDRPPWLGRLSIMDSASAQVSHERRTGSTGGPSPLRCASVGVWDRGGTTGTAARAETRCSRGYIASQRLCVVLTMPHGPAERDYWLSQAPSGPQCHSAVMASPQPRPYGPRTQAFSPCRDSDPGIRDSGLRRRERGRAAREAAAEARRAK